MVEDLPHDGGAAGSSPEGDVRAAPVIDAEALVQAAVQRIAEDILSPAGRLEPQGRAEPTPLEGPALEADAVVADPGTEPPAPSEPAGSATEHITAPLRILEAAVEPQLEAVASEARLPTPVPAVAAIAPEPAPPEQIRPDSAAPLGSAPGGEFAPEPPIGDREGQEGWRGLLSGPWTVRRAARLAGLAVAAYFGFVLFLILVYRFINPPTTTLIAYQWLTGTKIEQEWVPIEDISSNLLRAVVVSEDWGFCDHYGVDLVAIEKALEQAGEGKVARGASTISMQVIKNLFLSQSKSYLRKAIEIPLTFVAEAVWPKSRMLEIYLNIAEWGPGVFGAEAAARHHFSKHASELSQREAALLAAALPNPILRDAGDPGTRTARKASVIQQRMRAAGPVADCAMTGRQRSSEVKPDNVTDSPPGWQTTVKKRAGGS